MYWDQRVAQRCIGMYHMDKCMEIALTAGEMQKYVEKNLYVFSITKPIWSNVPVQNIGKCNWDTAAKAQLVGAHKSLQLVQIQCLALIDTDV